MKVVIQRVTEASVSVDDQVISQFTLYGDSRKGTRPSFSGAAKPDLARPIYDRFIEKLRQKYPHVGLFSREPRKCSVFEFLGTKSHFFIISSIAFFITSATLNLCSVLLNSYFPVRFTFCQATGDNRYMNATMSASFISV